MNSVGKKTLSDEADDDTEPQNDVDPQQQQKANTLISSQPIQRAIQGKNDTIQCNPTLKRCRHYCRNGCDNCCRCCAASDTSAPVVEPCSECVKDIVFQKLVKDGFTTQQAHEIQEDVVILTDSAGSETTVPSSQAQDRLTRLHSNKKILYHQTSEDSAKAILESKQFRRGSDGMAGVFLLPVPVQEPLNIQLTVIWSNFCAIVAYDQALVSILQLPLRPQGSRQPRKDQSSKQKFCWAAQKPLILMVINPSLFLLCSKKAMIV